MASQVPDPETLHKAVTETVRRLIDALAAEAKSGSRLRQKRRALRQRRRATPTSIQQRIGDYTRALRRYSEGIQALFRIGDQQNANGRGVGHREYVSQWLRTKGFKSFRRVRKPRS